MINYYLFRHAISLRTFRSCLMLYETKQNLTTAVALSVKIKLRISNFERKLTGHDKFFSAKQQAVFCVKIIPL
jgi:hypothetical protein